MSVTYFTYILLSHRNSITLQLLEVIHSRFLSLISGVGSLSTDHAIFFLFFFLILLREIKS